MSSPADILATKIKKVLNSARRALGSESVRITKVHGVDEGNEIRWAGFIRECMELVKWVTMLTAYCPGTMQAQAARKERWRMQMDQMLTSTQPMVSPSKRRDILRVNREDGAPFLDNMIMHRNEHWHPPASPPKTVIFSVL